MLTLFQCTIAAFKDPSAKGGDLYYSLFILYYLWYLLPFEIENAL